MKVYVVGHHGPEHNSIRSIHKSYKNALKELDKLRMKLLKEAKYILKGDSYGKEMFREIIKNLSCKDPKKIDNYPQETLYIREYEVRE